MATLGECRRELKSIIQELDNIEWELRYSAQGVGENLCADCIGGIASKYRLVLNRLNNVNYNRLAQWAIKDE